MLYRVLANGYDILDFSNQQLVLLSPQLTMEIDTAGNFEFTVPPNHLYYDMFSAESIMSMMIEVYEDTVMHWFGRPLELHLDFYKNKKIYCEGGFGFFNDSIIREAEYEDILLSTIFSAVIAEHNSMVPANRQFTVGSFTVSDHTVYRKFNYEQTSDVLKSKFLDAEDGHFFLRRENGVNYIDFLKDMPYSCNQEVEFAKNLLNFTYSFDGKDFATCVIPLGANDEETNKPITISSVNGNSDILIGSAAANYGQIIKVQHYGDLKDPYELYSEGQKYLLNLQYNAYLIECSAVDLHSKDNTEQLFKVGQKVTCISNPHGINLELPISKMTLYLDSAAKQITLGRIPKKTLARFYKENINNGNEGNYTEEIEPVIPSGWEIVPPDEDGGEPTLKRVPIMIDITHLPLQTNYTDSDNDFDPTGIEVKLVAQGLPNLQYFSDEWYSTGVVPTSELTYEIGGMGIPTQPIAAGGEVPSKAQIMVWVIWTCAKSGCPYIGKKFRKAFYIQNTDAAARDAANTPDHITVVSTGLDMIIHKVGQFINFSGVRVKAYLPDGSEYDAPGYSGGLIPSTELIYPLKTVNVDNEQAAIEERTSDLNTSPFQKPIEIHSSISVHIKQNVNVYGSAAEYVINDYEYSGAKFITYVYDDGSTVCLAAGDSNPGYNAHTKSQSFYLENDEETGDPYETNSNGIQFSNSYTYKEKTVYRTSFYVYSPSAQQYANECYVNGPNYKYDNLSSLVTSGLLDRLAWTMVYGDVESEFYYMNVPVNWKAPNGVTLTTSFKIKVKVENNENSGPVIGN